MDIYIIFMAIILSIFSTAVMSFITMAVLIGPWIDVTLILLSTIIVQVFFRKMAESRKGEMLGFASSAGAIGGSVATACGFSLPTLYFLKQDIFASWMSSPSFFIFFMAVLVIAAGGLGLLVADFFDKRMLADASMSFPVGHMLYNMIEVRAAAKQAYLLVAGLLSALVYGVSQTVLKIFPNKMVLLTARALGAFCIPSIILSLELIPVFWAIGFVTGHIVAGPLAFGALLKIFMVNPLHKSCFTAISANEFLFAFCGGIVLFGAVMSLIALPKFLRTAMQRISAPAQSIIGGMQEYIRMVFSLPLLLVVIFAIISLLTYFSFSIFAQMYLVAFSLLCTYQLLVIGGKTGMAPVGRYATFVMLPGIFLFGFDAVQMTIVTMFVELSGMVAVDALFGRKMAQLAAFDQEKMKKYQWLGLLVAALIVGGAFWLLIYHFGLGSEKLSAQRGLSRALLVNALSFDYYVLAFGVVVGFVLHRIRVNPMLVMGGLLLPLELSILLVMGGASTYLCKDKEVWMPFWSGVFAASALWLMLKAIW